MPCAYLLFSPISQVTDSRLIFLCNGHFDGAELYRLSLSKKSKTVLTVSIQKKYQNTKGKQEMSEKVFITVTGKIK